MPEQAADLPLVLYPKDVAALLRIHERHARRLLSRGELGPVCRAGGRVRILRDVLLATLAGRDPDESVTQ